MQIHSQLGPATFRLTDGSRWHASRLCKVTAQRQWPASATAIPNPQPYLQSGWMHQLHCYPPLWLEPQTCSHLQRNLIHGLCEYGPARNISGTMSLISTLDC
ncbi:hypothetical protein AAFF_G00024440 [Aldrovandia affinis]|uniref:Uncharacterized protein n=1 Tax=Aldrovandia affinis TaxID=143900 RepID=A0AAD7T7B9_9TELE|nr:hypothetical protein AAFF_G00024440 [Aldrovandia affinis]